MKHYETKGERLVQDRGMYAHHMVQCCNCSAITTLHGHLHGLVWGFGILRFSFSFCVWLEPLFAPPSLPLSLSRIQFQAEPAWDTRFAQNPPLHVPDQGIVCKEGVVTALRKHTHFSGK